MSSDNPIQLIQCAGCNSKLRVRADAAGKTVACPKCGCQVKMPGSSSPSIPPVVVARPVSAPTNYAAPTSQPGPPVANSVNTWESSQYAAAGNYQPYTAPRAQSPKPASRMWLWIALGGGAFMVFGMVAVAMIAWAVAIPRPVNTPPTASNFPPARAPAVRPTPNAGEVPSRPRRAAAGTNVVSGGDNGGVIFPPLGIATPFGNSVELYRVSILRNGKPPFVMNVFMPKGVHATKSLPVMFESPSGTNLLHGADVGFPKLETEILPFTEAGMITVTFSIEGAMPDGSDPSAARAYFAQLERAYIEFVGADAGVASGQLAINYVLAQIPEADPKRMYVWGHSSSATLALLLAAKDRRISKCIALAPITDLKLRLGEIASSPAMSKKFPNLEDHFKNGSPISYVDAIQCPVYIAHAKDDDNEPFENTQAFVDAFNKAGGKVEFEALPRGGHSRGPLTVSLPKAVQWVQK